MATMTISDAEHILDVVSAALQEQTNPYYLPISSLQGYDVFQIDMALKLRIANEFLFLAEEDDFEERFADRIQAYGSVPLYIVSDFVADDDLARLKELEPDSPEFKQLKLDIRPRPLDSSTMTFKDKQLATLETPSSFGDYCRRVGAKDPIYWQKIYTRIGLDYTSESPRGNERVFVDENKIQPER